MLQRRELVADSADFAHERRDVLSPSFRGADLFRHRVALRLQLLRARLDRLALGFHLFELRGVEQVTTRLEPCGDAGQIAAQQFLQLNPPDNKPVICIWTKPQVWQSLLVSTRTTIPLGGNGMPLELFEMLEGIKSVGSRLLSGPTVDIDP